METMDKVVGTKREVYRNKALKTVTGLTRSDLTLNSKGKIVYKRLSEQSKRSSNLGAYLIPKKGAAP